MIKRWQISEFWADITLLNKALRSMSVSLGAGKKHNKWAKLRVSIWIKSSWQYWFHDRPLLKEIKKLEKKLGLD